MSNPVALTVTTLTANAATAQPTADAIDTNGTVPAAIESQHEHVIIEVVNTDDAALTVAVKAGAEGAGAGRAGLGDLSVALSATGGGTDKKIIGPFEPARFMQADGKLNISFTAATGAPAASVRCYRLPKSA
jgi:hypothetical protein